jgi:hypothetical protein
MFSQRGSCCQLNYCLVVACCHLSQRPLFVTGGAWSQDSSRSTCMGTSIISNEKTRSTLKTIYNIFQPFISLILLINYFSLYYCPVMACDLLVLNRWTHHTQCRPPKEPSECGLQPCLRQLDPTKTTFQLTEKIKIFRACTDWFAKAS